MQQNIFYFEKLKTFQNLSFYKNQKMQNEPEKPKRSTSLDLDLLISLVTDRGDPKNPSINLTKLDNILRNFSIKIYFLQNSFFFPRFYQKEERKLIKKSLNLFKNQKGLLTIDGFRSFFEISEKENKTPDDEIATSEELGLLYDMISTVDGKITHEIDLKKIKEFTRVLEIDTSDDRNISVMYKLARNPETGKLSREDMMKLGTAFLKSKKYLT